MSRKKQETKVLCPGCGTEFAIADKEFAATGTVIGKNSDLGTVYPVVAGHNSPAGLPKGARERIEALRGAGVDVSCLFAMQGAEGGEYIASNKDGKLTILDDNDPIFGSIMAQGTVPNNRLFRRWVMAQMFHMMSYTHYREKEPAGVTEMIHRKGYDYQWKMLLNELHAQMKMEHKDITGFAERNRWFNRDVVLAIASDYVNALKKHVGNLETRKCKGSVERAEELFEKASL